MVPLQTEHLRQALSCFQGHDVKHKVRRYVRLFLRLKNRDRTQLAWRQSLVTQTLRSALAKQLSGPTRSRKTNFA